MKIDKLKTAEHSPAFLLLISTIAYCAADFQWYADCFDYLEKIINCCFGFCFFAWLVSENWGFAAKRCLMTLILLNILDLVYTRIEPDIYYHVFRLVLIYTIAIILIYAFHADRRKS